MSVFIFLEILNVIILYFKPGFNQGNGMGVFNAWEKSKKDKEVHELVKYLVYWVAGTKLIFILLLVVIIVKGTWTTQLYAVGALILSILTFFWKLFPIVRGMDKRGQITPKGYSKVLGIMIGGFIVGFLTVFIIAILRTPPV